MMTTVVQKTTTMVEVEKRTPMTVGMKTPRTERSVILINHIDTCCLPTHLRSSAERRLRRLRGFQGRAQVRGGQEAERLGHCAVRQRRPEAVQQEGEGQPGQGGPPRRQEEEANLPAGGATQSRRVRLGVRGRGGHRAVRVVPARLLEVRPQPQGENTGGPLLSYDHCSNSATPYQDSDKESTRLTDVTACDITVTLRESRSSAGFFKQSVR